MIPSTRIWLHAWAEFEALNALAAYAYENQSTPPSANRPRPHCYMLISSTFESQIAADKSGYQAEPAYT